MRNNIRRIISLFAILNLLFGACQTKKEMDALDAFTVIYDDAPYRIDSAQKLLFFVEKVSGQAWANIQSAKLEELRDELGVYQAIRAAYEAEGKKVQLVAPLHPVAGQPAVFTTDCIMLCTLDPDCFGGHYLIHQRCARLSCGCEEGAGGGSPEVRF